MSDAIASCFDDDDDDDDEYVMDCCKRDIISVLSGLRYLDIVTFR